MAMPVSCCCAAVMLLRSLTLEADAFHMLSDVASLVAGHYAQAWAQMAPTADATFGWGRAEVIGER